MKSKIVFCCKFLREEDFTGGCHCDPLVIKPLITRALSSVGKYIKILRVSKIVFQDILDRL